MAGFQAAKAIRERDKTGTVMMISNEPYESYNRPMLTKSMVAGLECQSRLQSSRVNGMRKTRFTGCLENRSQKIDVEQKK